MKSVKVTIYLLFLGLLFSCQLVETADKIGVDEIEMMFDGMEEGGTVVIDGEDLDEELLDLFATAMKSIGEEFEIGEIELIQGDIEEKTGTTSKYGAYIVERRQAYGRHCSHSRTSSCPRSNSKGRCSKLGYGWVRISRRFSWGPPAKQVDVYLCKNYKGRRNCCRCKVKVTSIYVDRDGSGFYTRDVGLTP